MDKEIYCWLTILEQLRTLGYHINEIGGRPQTDGKDQWLDFVPSGDQRAPSRKNYKIARLLFQVACVARIPETTGDQFKPQRMAGEVLDLLEQKNLEILTIGEAPETHVGCLQINEGTQRYFQRANRSFEGKGDLTVEQSNTHAVIVTFDATLVV